MRGSPSIEEGPRDEEGISDSFTNIHHSALVMKRAQVMRSGPSYEEGILL